MRLISFALWCMAHQARDLADVKAQCGTADAVSAILRDARNAERLRGQFIEVIEGMAKKAAPVAITRERLRDVMRDSRLSEFKAEALSMSERNAACSAIDRLAERLGVEL